MSDPKKTAAIVDATKNGQLVQINMNEIKDQVGDQIRAFLLNMMPKEVFDNVIETAWKNLTEPRPPKPDQWGNVRGETKPSELEEMVTNAMRQELRKRVSEWGEEWRQTDDCELGAKTMFKELTEMAAGKFINRVAAQIVQEAAGVLASGAHVQTVNCGSCHRTAVPGNQCSCGFWN